MSWKFWVTPRITNIISSELLFIVIFVEHNTQALNEIYIQEDDFCAQAETFILESLDEKVRK